MVLNLKKTDDVIIPPMIFVATVSVIKLLEQCLDF